MKGADMADVKDVLLDAIQAEPGTVEIELDGQRVRVALDARRFGTGSAGYFWQGKLQGQDGRRYQVQVQATVIGSKPGK